MKKLLLALCLLFSTTAFTACGGDDDDVVISINDLPQVSQNFLSTHFPNIGARLVEKDNDSYDVILNNGFEIDFFLDGEWDSVDGISQPVPESVLSLLPAAILSDLKTNAPNSKVVEVNKEIVRNVFVGYEVTLDHKDGIERKYDKEGNFIRIDD
ncbi:MAG: PepSY-like domain-containing protein [Dysgonomonas sp.]